MPKAIWISYDFGLKGDYTGFYTWLDNHKAVECGHGLAFLNYSDDSNSSPQLLENLKTNLLKTVKLSESDRLYIIWKEYGKPIVKGQFINGARRQSPWEGYGKRSDSSIQDISE